MAGFAAAQGLLSAPLLLIAAALGSFAGDQCYFWIGRHFGLRLIARRPEWRARVDRALEWLTRYDAARAARGEMMKVEDVLEILAIPLLGVVLESQDVLTASNLGCPVVLHNPRSAAAKAYDRAARRLLGEEIAAVAAPERRGLMSRLFGRRAAA